MRSLGRKPHPEGHFEVLILWSEQPSDGRGSVADCKPYKPLQRKLAKSMLAGGGLRPWDGCALECGRRIGRSRAVSVVLCRVDTTPDNGSQGARWIS